MLQLASATRALSSVLPDKPRTRIIALAQLSACPQPPGILQSAGSETAGAGGTSAGTVHVYALVSFGASADVSLVTAPDGTMLMAKSRLLRSTTCTSSSGVA